MTATLTIFPAAGKAADSMTFPSCILGGTWMPSAAMSDRLLPSVNVLGVRNKAQVDGVNAPLIHAGMVEFHTIGNRPYEQPVGHPMSSLSVHTCTPGPDGYASVPPSSAAEPEPATIRSIFVHEFQEAGLQRQAGMPMGTDGHGITSTTPTIVVFHTETMAKSGIPAFGDGTGISHVLPPARSVAENHKR